MLSTQAHVSLRQGLLLVLRVAKTSA